jgi:hypothetical protein
MSVPLWNSLVSMWCCSMMVGVIDDVAVSPSCLQLNLLCLRNRGDIVCVVVAFIRDFEESVVQKCPRTIKLSSHGCLACSAHPEDRQFGSKAPCE